MANNYIQVDTTKNRGASCVNAASQMSYVVDNLTRIKQAMDNMIVGADYTVVEAQFGVPTGKGQTLYNIIAGCVTDLNASVNVSQLVSWLGITR